MKILVLGGGNSIEREVSLRSAAAVAKACRLAGFDVTEADPADGYDFLDNLPRDVLVFPILHGKGGEDGEIQEELEKRGLSFLGTGSKASRQCFNKAEARKILTDAGIPMAEGAAVDAETYRTHPLFTQPHVLKAVGGGSSIGTYIVRNPENLNEAQVEEVFQVSDQAVIEELIEGVEATVPILDNAALPVIEIIPPMGGEFDYENKYNGATSELCPPANISEATQRHASELAEKVHQVMGARHLSRVDLMISSGGLLKILEINTMPGMTDHSLFPKSAKAAGITFPDLMKRFAALVASDMT